MKERKKGVKDSHKKTGSSVKNKDISKKNPLLFLEKKTSKPVLKTIDKEIQNPDKINLNTIIKRKPNLFALTIIAVLSIIAIGLFIFVLVIYNYSLKLDKENNQTITLLGDIESVSIDELSNSLFIRLIDNNDTDSDNKVRFILIAINGTIYIKDTNRTFNELILSEVNIPEKKNIFGFLSSKETIPYHYFISLDEISGLNSFDEIVKINLSFYSLRPAGNNGASLNINITGNRTSVAPSQSSSSSTSSSNPTTITTTPVNNCTDSPWQNHSYFCNPNGAREMLRTRTICTSGNTEERNFSVPCNEGYRCYEGIGYPSEKCINSSLYCIDSDFGINSSVNGTVNASGNIKNDICINQKNLTEYYCLYSSGNFIIENNTITCEYACDTDKCIFCSDIDKDGYSTDNGTCGEFDCNDNNLSIRPNATEICGNDVDENCDGYAMGCMDLERGLVAYYRFNDGSSSLIIDETSSNNIICSSDDCPSFNGSGGLNGSGTYQFDGIDDYLTFPKILNNISYSISFWIKPTTAKVSTIIYSDSGGEENTSLYLYYNALPNNKQIEVSNNYGLDNTLLKTGKNSIIPSIWSNIIFIYDAEKNLSELYYNGTKTGEDSIFLNNPEQTRIVIGTYLGNINDYYYNGNIDELRVYNRTLTGIEISNLSYLNMTIPITTPVAELPSIGFFDSIIKWIKNLF
jgi:hypothetical protein